MRWFDALSRAPDVRVAAEDCVRQLQELSGDSAFDLLLFFSSHGEDVEKLPALLAKRVSAKVQLGCSAGGVIASFQEVEDSPALAVLAAKLPNVALQPFYISAQALPDPERERQEWQRLFEQHPSESSFLLLPDPVSFHTEVLLDGLHRHWPGVMPFGGQASGLPTRGGHQLFFGEESRRGGLVGVGLSGAIKIETIVAQGCRPVGSPLFVTKCRGSVVQELDCRAPEAVLSDLLASVSSEDRIRIEQGLFLGVGRPRGDKEYDKNEFVVRNLLGVDEQHGYLIVSDHLEEAQIVQFYVRDAQASKEDLDKRLQDYAADRQIDDIRAVLLFSCLGRGEQLYHVRNHDSELLRKHFGISPMAGFFCGGEIGRVHRRAYLHGYTSVVGVISEASSSTDSSK